MLSSTIFSGIIPMFPENIFSQFSGSDVPLGQLVSIWITIMVTAVVVCFLVSEITRNYSQVDKLWSIMPLVYSFVTLASFPSPRIWIMSIAVTLWGLRLSFNFYRKGGYSLIPWRGEEDYRWIVARQKPLLKGRFRFGLFNLFFISFYQHFLILLFSSPLLLAAKNRGSELTLLDFIAATLMMLFLVIETIADNQQFRFQSLKHKQVVVGDLFSG
jgi:steroid 5-alpha reductase family enzyme